MININGTPRSVSYTHLICVCICVCLCVCARARVYVSIYITIDGTKNWKSRNEGSRNKLVKKTPRTVSYTHLLGTLGIKS